MKRDPNRLAGQRFDVLIVGAGIYGAWAARDAAQRGLTVALIDRGDFGGETSANNLRIVHGGLRYTQHLDFNRMRESIREQRIALETAPHLVHPLACMVPTYGRGLRGRLALRAALALNDFVARGRNRGASPGKSVPRSRIVGVKRVKELLPDVPDEGLTGGAVWHDAQVLDPERMVLGIVKSAAADGAAVANYVAADRLLVERGRVVGAAVTDRLTGEAFFVRASVTVNFTGPGADALLASALPERAPKLFPFSQAWNLVVRRSPPSDHAFGLYSRRAFRDRDARVGRKGRLLFFTPWRGTTLLGTSHCPYARDVAAETFGHDEAEIADLLADAAEAWPGARLTRGDVLRAFGGMLPGEADPTSGQVRLVKHPVIRDHGRADGLPGILTGVGVKFTTARLVAARLVDMAAAAAGRQVDACRTAATRIHAGEIDDWPAYLASAREVRPRSVAAPVFDRLVENYGRDHAEVLALTCQEGRLLDPVTPGSEVLQAEVVHAVREEMAVKLADVVRRRTDLGKRAPAELAVLQRVAALMASELGWDAGRRAGEVAEVLAAEAAFL